MHINRRQFLAAAAAVPLLGQVPPPPSYLMILVDQLTWWMCEPGQRGLLELPNIDRLRAEGQVYNRCYATSPVCSASRISLRTGLWPHANPGNHKLIHPIATLEEALQGRGYRTEYFGKWHMSPDPDGQFVKPQDRLHWDSFIGHESDHRHDITFKQDDPRKYSTAPWDSAYMTDAALKSLRKTARSDQPFFLHINYLPPHQPYSKYPKSLEEYSTVQGTLRANAVSVDGHADRYVAMYMNLVRGVDIEIGRLLDELDTLESKAVVVFASDHGDMLGSHGMIYKRKPHEESARVPLVVRGAGWTPGVVDYPVGLVDLARTLGDVGQGTDLREHRDSVYYEMTQHLGSWEQGQWRALVTEDGWKLAIGEHGPRMLINLEDDPFELENLAGAGHSREAELETRMREWAGSTKDDFFRS